MKRWLSKAIHQPNARSRAESYSFWKLVAFKVSQTSLLKVVGPNLSILIGLPWLSWFLYSVLLTSTLLIPWSGAACTMVLQTHGSHDCGPCFIIADVRYVTMQYTFSLHSSSWKVCSLFCNYKEGLLYHRLGCYGVMNLIEFCQYSLYQNKFLPKLLLDRLLEFITVVEGLSWWYKKPGCISYLFRRVWGVWKNSCFVHANHPRIWPSSQAS